MFHDVNIKKLICMISNKSIFKHKLDGVTGERLSHLHDAPAMLFYRGANPNELLNKPSVAIVGSRKMTAYGRGVTEKLARDLANAGVVATKAVKLNVFVQVGLVSPV